MVSKGELIQQSARRLGIDPLDWANVISYETIGSFDPQKRGGKDNKYVGLIQMGPEERKTYGGGEKQSFEDNLRASERYMVHRGLKPGMNLLDIYSTVNAGSPGHYNASDGHNTVAGHVQEMSGEYRKKAAALLGEQYHPSEDAQLAQRDLSPTELTTASTSRAPNRLLAPAYGPSTIIGGMSNEPMNSSNRLLPSDSGAPEDNLDTTAWATKGFGIAAPTVSPVSDTVSSPVVGIPQSRPAGPLDQPVTENAGQQSSMIAGNAGTDSLPGGDSADDELGSIVDGLDQPAADHSDELDSIVQGLDTEKPKVEIPSPSARIGPPAADMGAMAPLYYGVSKSTFGVPLGQTAHALGEDINQFFSPNLPQYSHAENYQRVGQAYKDYEEAHPFQAIGSEALGSVPSTMVGLGAANKLFSVGGKLASKLGPTVERGVNYMGDFFSGRAGAWGEGIGAATERTVSKIATGALEGGETGAMQSGNTENPDVSRQAEVGAGLGALFGAGGSLVQKAIQSPALSPVAAGVREVIDRAQRLFRDPEAVPLGGNVAMDESTQMAHKRLLAGEPETKNLQAYTGEVIRSFGGEGKELTVPVLQRNADRIGKNLDNIMAETHMTVDMPLERDLTDWTNNLHKTTSPGPQYGKLRRVAGDLIEKINNNNGELTGDIFQDITKHNSELGKIIRGKDAHAAAYAQALEDIFDQAVDRTLASQGAKSIVIDGKVGKLSDLLGDARQQWRNLQIASDAMESGAPSGVVDPEKLSAAAKVKFRGGRHSNPDDLMQTLVDTAPYMPKVTPQGAAKVEYSAPVRLRSSIVANTPGIASLGGLGSTIGYAAGNLPGAVIGGVSGALLGASRDIPLRKMMENPKYMNLLLGDRQAIKDLAGTGTARKVGIALANPLIQEYRGR